MPSDDPAAKGPKRRVGGKSRCSACKLLASALLLSTAAVGWWLTPPLLKAWRNERSPDHPSEASFSTGDTQKPPLPFPSLFDPASLTLSVVVPAYNEEARMHVGLNEMIAVLSEKHKQDSAFTWEIIIVDDGSRDATAAIALRDFVAPHGSDRVRLLKLFRNGGKGAAVRKGMLRTRGAFVLMADADGATRFGDMDALLAAAKRIQQPSDGDALSFAIGSRAHMTANTAGRSIVRRVFSWGFHAAIQLLMGGSDIRDTQCGFKLFSRAAARALFPVLHIERWAFDVELVYLAARSRVPMVEVPVAWHEVAGSKLDPTSAALQMARDVIVIRLAYATGLWQ